MSLEVGVLLRPRDFLQIANRDVINSLEDHAWPFMKGQRGRSCTDDYALLGSPWRVPLILLFHICFETQIDCNSISQSGIKKFDSKHGQSAGKTSEALESRKASTSVLPLSDPQVASEVHSNADTSRFVIKRNLIQGPCGTLHFAADSWSLNSVRVMDSDKTILADQIILPNENTTINAPKSFPRGIFCHSWYGRDPEVSFVHIR